MPMRSSLLTVALNLAAMNLAANPAIAQVQLRGAASGGPPIVRGVVVRAPHESTIMGRELRLNGESGRLTFAQQGADFVISRFVLAGKKIS